MSKGRDRTVYRRSSDNKWIDKRNDTDRGFAFDTQRDAINSAHGKITNAGGGEVTVKGVNGRIRSKDTIGGGNDPIPPRDREH